MKKLIMLIAVSFLFFGVVRSQESGEKSVTGWAQASTFFEEFLDYSNTNPVELIIAASTWQKGHGDKEKFLRSVIRECKEFWANEPCHGKIYEKLNSLFPPNGVSPLELPDPKLVTALHNYYYYGAVRPISSNNPEGMWGEVKAQIKP